VPTTTALLDACVLYPAPLRDLLIHLALADLFRARWTEAIHEEWMRNVLADRPDLSAERLQRTRRLMDRAIPDALVEGYEELIPPPTLPDPGDLHVVAAAVHARAEVIVTFNLKHFPANALGPYGLRACHPDDFFCSLLEQNPGAVCEAVRTQREGLRKPPVSAAELLATFEALQLLDFAARLRPLANQL
jgi:hypothetical protein